MLGCWSRWGNKPWLGFVKAMQHSIRDCSGRRHWTRVHYAAGAWNFKYMARSNRGLALSTSSTLESVRAVSPASPPVWPEAPCLPKSLSWDKPCRRGRGWGPKVCWWFVGRGLCMIWYDLYIIYMCMCIFYNMYNINKYIYMCVCM